MSVSTAKLSSLVAMSVFTLAGCGGGGSSGTNVQEMLPGEVMPNEMPDAMAGPLPLPEGHGYVTGWRDNSTAEDLLDHWNQPQAVRQALGLTTVDEADVAGRMGAIARLIGMAEDDEAMTPIRLRDVRPDDIDIVGQRNGITYGRWTGGPAGTLNIEFDWRFAPNVDAGTRAQVERAGKSWSRRLLDDFGTHVVESGTEVAGYRDFSGVELFNETFEEDVSTNGMLIFVFHPSPDPLSGGGPGPLEAEITDDDYEPWFGNLVLSQNTINERRTIGNWWWIHVVAHELGHAVGITSHAGGWSVPSLERYIDRREHTFTGPRAQKANGGNPVPFQWLDRDRQAVAPGTPGASVDYAHLGICTSIMAYCVNPRITYQPSELDFAFLDDIGYDLLDAETAAEPEIYGYGAWGAYSAWGAGVERVLGYEDDGTDVSARDRLRAGADAFGIAPGMGFADRYLPPETSLGSVTWSGSLIGVDLGSGGLPPVFGDAMLSVDLSNFEGALRFDDLTVLTEGRASPFRAGSLEYFVDVSGNAFSDQAGRVHGMFYGPGHEEMAGVLHDDRPDIDLLGGFGGLQ